MTGKRTTVIVARHGAAAYETKVWTSEGGSLTDVGRREAHGLADRVMHRKVAHVWTSPLSRAVQTGEIVASRLSRGVTVRLGLREFDVGDFVGSPEKDPFAPTYARWLAGELDLRLPGGETGEELVARFRTTLHEVIAAHPGETSLVVSHGGIMRLVLPILLTQEPAHPPARLGNCDAVELEVEGKEWVCTEWPQP